MTNETNLYDISAEFLLNYLYPDLMNRWKVDCVGTFYRNYSEDILEIDEEKTTVLLARDSFLRLLPQGLIATDKALKGGNFELKYENLKKKEEFRATMAMLWVTIGCYITGNQIQSGYFNSQVIFLCLVGMIPLFAGIWAGTKLVKRIDQETFLKLTYVLLIVSGVLAIV